MHLPLALQQPQGVGEAGRLCRPKIESIHGTNLGRKQHMADGKAVEGAAVDGEPRGDDFGDGRLRGLEPRGRLATVLDHLEHRPLECRASPDRGRRVAIGRAVQEVLLIRLELDVLLVGRRVDWRAFAGGTEIPTATQSLGAANGAGSILCRR